MFVLGGLQEPTPTICAFCFPPRCSMYLAHSHVCKVALVAYFNTVMFSFSHSRASWCLRSQNSGLSDMNTMASIQSIPEFYHFPLKLCLGGRGRTVSRSGYFTSNYRAPSERLLCVLHSLNGVGWMQKQVLVVVYSCGGKKRNLPT